MTFAFPSRLLGELLVEQGLIVPADLDEALAEQRATGRRLGEVLVSRGALTGAQLTRALAGQYGIELSAVTVSALDRSTGGEPTAARRDPGLRACLDAWLASKPLPPRMRRVVS